MKARNPASRASFFKVYCLFDGGMNKGSNSRQFTSNIWFTTRRKLHLKPSTKHSKKSIGHAHAKVDRYEGGEKRSKTPRSSPAEAKGDGIAKNIDKSKTSPITRTSRPQTTANTAITEAAIQYEIQTSNNVYEGIKKPQNIKKKTTKTKITGGKKTKKHSKSPPQKTSNQNREPD
jgi:hypothetical protein